MINLTATSSTPRAPFLGLPMLSNYNLADPRIIRLRASVSTEVRLQARVPWSASNVPNMLPPDQR